VTVLRQPRFVVPADAAQLILIRHGESEPVRDGVVFARRNGQADPDLDPVGELEAARAAARLSSEPLVAVYSSPLRRALHTARPLGEALGIAPVVLEDLREVFLGEVDGLNLSALWSRGDEHVRRALREQRWELIPGAERQVDFERRVRVTIGEIAEKHRGEAAAVVTHGGFIAQALTGATRCAPHAFLHADNASFTHLVVTPRAWKVRNFNDTGHLRASIIAASEESAGRTR
jgi:probable phosphoglycerate mutase